MKTTSIRNGQMVRTIGVSSIKVIIAALLFGCLLQMPYGYYIFIRIACLVGFLILSMTEYNDRPFLAIPCFACALLFNPVIPVFLNKEVWQQIDVITASLLLIWFITDIVLNLVYGKNKEQQLKEGEN